MILRNRRNVVLIDKDTTIAEDHEYPLTDGFRLRFKNSPVEFLSGQSKWNNANVAPFTFAGLTAGSVRGTQVPYDYTVIFGNVGFDTSRTGTIATSTFPSKQVNFKVRNDSKGELIDFVFIEVDT